MRCHFALLDEPKKEITSYGQDDDLQRPHHPHISHMSFSNLYFDLEKGCRLIWSHRTMQFQVSYIEKGRQRFQDVPNLGQGCFLHVGELEGVESFPDHSISSGYIPHVVRERGKAE